jgi:hypothetical protein
MGTYTGERVPIAERREIWAAHRYDGINMQDLARRFKRAPATISAICNDLKNSSGNAWLDERLAKNLADPLDQTKLESDAQRALTDFGFFRRRFFGRIASPWQEDAATKVVEWLETPHKEFVVVNCPPGSGKSTLFTHDIPAWLACRNRNIRCLIGSRTMAQAKMYTGRLRRTFERVLVLKVDEEEVRKGFAVQPDSTLSKDYGRFRPVGGMGVGTSGRDVWRQEEFLIAGIDDEPTSEKEASFSAFGMDTGFLGGRYDYVIWDDLVDRKTLRTEQARRDLERLYEHEMETRLEPGGVLILQGQRMHADDLYRYALDQKLDSETETRKYAHVVYKAHYEERCGSLHSVDDVPYDPAGGVGCLLDPRRLTWRDLSSVRANRMEKYRVLYQQEDVDPASVLVPKDWILGGRDSETGEEFPGCIDAKRRVGEIPQGLSQPILSIASADPSPTKWWAVMWWIYHPETEQRFLIDLHRSVMEAPEFLDYDYNEGRFTGIMEEWQARSADSGHPITTWIVEANAAQRFLLQYDHVKRWQAKRGVNILPHQTHRNKTDADYGVQSIAPHYRYGRVRLPGHQDTRYVAERLIGEVTRYPDSVTDDCVMAQWMFEWNLPRIYVPDVDIPRSWRPSWLRAS